MAQFNDLLQALSVFKQGMQDLSISRSINGANDAVAQIRNSEMKDAEKRQALTDISNQLVSRLTAAGAPAEKIQMMAGAIGPKHYANSNQMNLEGLMSGNADLQAQAKQQQEFESNKAFELARIKASQSPVDNAFKQAKFEEMKAQSDLKAFDKLEKSINPENHVRDAYGRAAIGVQTANKLDALVGSAANSVKTANALPPQVVNEMALGLAGMIKGGVPDQTDVEKFAPKTLGMDQAKLQSYLTNGVPPAEAGQFVQLYKKTIDRERSELQTQLEDTALAKAQANIGLHKRNPDVYKEMVAKTLGVSPDEVIVNGNKVTTAKLQKIDQDTKMAIEGLKRAYQNQGSPESNQIFQALGLKPGTPLNEAVNSVKYKIRRGQL